MGAVLDTGAGPNCIKQKILPPGWRNYLTSSSPTPLVDAQHNTIPTAGTILLYIQVGELLARVSFTVCEKLTVPLILGTAYINRLVSSINIEDHRLILRDNSSTAILGKLPKGPDSRENEGDQTGNNQSEKPDHATFAYADR